MCKCVNIEIWSYWNQIYVPLNYLPKHMKEYRLNRRWKDHKKGICIDKCIYNEIDMLWKRWITTTGCCCGHNKLEWYIGVIDEDIEKMKEIWYTIQYNPSRPNDKDTFNIKD